jgi:hypothetical protein
MTQTEDHMHELVRPASPSRRGWFARFTTVELLFIAIMIAADFGFGLVVKPLLSATHILEVIRLDMIVPFAMLLITRLVVDKFGTLTIYELIIGILATLMWPTAFGIPGPLKIPLFVMQGLVWDIGMSALRPWLVPRLLATTIVGSLATNVAILGYRLALGLPFAPLVKVIWGVQLISTLAVGIVSVLIALSVWRSIRDLAVVRRMRAWQDG